MVATVVSATVTRADQFKNWWNKIQLEPARSFERKWSTIPTTERPAVSFALFPPSVLRELEYSGLAWVSAAIDRACVAVGMECQPLPKGIQRSRGDDPITRKLRSIDEGVQLSRYGSFVFSKNKGKIVAALSQELGGGIGEVADLVDIDKPGYPVLQVPTPIKEVIRSFHRGSYPGMVESVAPKSAGRSLI